jgi:hypothetical protein
LLHKLHIMNKILGTVYLWLFMLFASFAFLQRCTIIPQKEARVSLRDGFMSPPDSVRPGVYWFIMDGNLSARALTADLESMKEAGMGQVILMEVNVGLPRGHIDFMSDEWQDLFKHVVREAERLGIEITLGIGPGWTGSGGPWVKPEQSMMHLMASSVEVIGPETFTGILPVPAPYKPFFGEESLPPNLKELRNKYYEDVLVLAFPTPPIEMRIPDSDEKALYYRAPFSSQPGVKPFLSTSASYPDPLRDETIDKRKIVDISRFLLPDGRLKWNVPPGNWTIMRFGKRNNGAVTRPAPEPGLGFECNKFDTIAFDAHFNQFVGKLLRKVEPRMKARHAGWTMLHMDSWEMSAQNWTGNFRKEFTRRRGYDPMPYLPAYTGRIVGSLEESERFLWDVRLTSQEMVIENHALRAKELGRQYGLGLSIEPYDMNPCADLSLGAVADIPMCEFWSKGFGFNTVFSCFEAASLAHTQGLPVVAAESFTAGFDEAWKLFPGAIKNQGDWAFCTGINRFVYAIYTHNPFSDDVRPGMTSGPYGVHWDRSQTWWPMAKGYHTYISRCSYMLQQGYNVADILYLTPEGAPQVFIPPSSALEGNDTIPDHKGYNFDVCSPEMLIEKAKVKDHKVVFPGGASYSILVLPIIETMTPELLVKIEELIRNGAVIIGKPPRKSPSLVNYPRCDEQVARLAEKIWGGLNAPEIENPWIYGAGKIYQGSIFTGSLENQLYPEYAETVSVLRNMDLPEDFTSSGELRFIHRITVNSDVYFVANRTGKLVKTECRFRMDKGRPEVWDPLTGNTRPLNSFQRHTHETVIPMVFEPYQSFFIVFDHSGKDPDPLEKVNFPELSVVSEVNGNWTVTFDTVWGGPGKVKFEQLSDWSKHADMGIRYYSGIATYEITFSLPDNMRVEKGNSLYLDLGEVHNLARVTLNGNDLGVLWTDPWRVDISKDVLKTGNKLEIGIANLWVNRLIGDAFMPYDGSVFNQWPEWLLKGKPRTSGRYTFTSYDYYKKDSPLLKSGLIGPVKILRKNL